MNLTAIILMIGSLLSPSPEGGGPTAVSDSSVAGDVNGNTLLDIGDAQQIAAFILEKEGVELTGEGGKFIEANADKNGDGVVNIMDIVSVILDGKKAGTIWP